MELPEQGVGDETDQIVAARISRGRLVKKAAEELIGPRAFAVDTESQPTRKKRLKQTFMNLGDPEPWEQEHMMPDDQDDMTPLGHGELERHREMRHYARLVAWEMPLLSSMQRDRS
jgi:hypothetical protein